MTHFARPRLNVTRPYVALAAVVVCALGWSPPLGDPASEAADAEGRILAPGFETGAMRATPTTATARDVDRSIDRRLWSSLAAVVLLAGCLGALALSVTLIVEGRKAFGGEPWSLLGSRAPPAPALA